jgi:hypothetical protein
VLASISVGDNGRAVHGLCLIVYLEGHDKTPEAGPETVYSARGMSLPQGPSNTTVARFKLLS